MTTTHLLYLHGFRSSPLSAKAQLVGERVRREHPGVTWWCPQLPPSPQAAAELIRQVTVDWPVDRMAVVGSSLGGFYARWFALQTGCRAVLLNPAPFPARDLAAYIGEQTSWQNPDERFFFEPSFVRELAVLEGDIARLSGARPLSPDRLLALIATGDEVLDWREMQAFCAGGTLRVIEGGDHAISDFAEHMDAVFGFLQLNAERGPQSR